MGMWTTAVLLVVTTMLRSSLAQPGVGFPGGQPGAGFPGGQQGAGFPGGQPGAGFPGGQPGAGFPGGQQGAGFPGGQPGAGFPGGQQGTGFPGGQQGTGFPGGQQGTGFPGGQQGTGFPGGQQGIGFPGGQQGTGFPGGQQGVGFPGGQPGINFQGQSGANFPGGQSGAGFPAGPGVGQPVFQNTGNNFQGQGNTGFQITPQTPGFQNAPAFPNAGVPTQPGFGPTPVPRFNPGQTPGFQTQAGGGLRTGGRTPPFQPQPGIGMGPGGFQPNPAFNTFAGGPFNTFLPGQNPFMGVNQGVGSNLFPPPFTASANLLMSMTQNPQNFRYSTCYFNTSGSIVRGRADFRQFLFGTSPVDVRIQVAGMPDTMVESERGVHIHEYGDIGDACARVGPHFNPTQTRHGSQTSPAFMRHVGDLGNIRQSPAGLISTTFQDGVISLQGQTNINGRAVVITFERDDDGQGTNAASMTNGNTRTPIACCVIARTNNENWVSPLSETDLVHLGNVGGFGSVGFQDNTGFNSDPTFNAGFNSDPTFTAGFNSDPTFTASNTGNNFGFTGITQNGRKKRSANSG